MGTKWIAGDLRFLKKETSQQELIFIIQTVHRTFRIKMPSMGLLAAMKTVPMRPPHPSLIFSTVFPCFYDGIICRQGTCGVGGVTRVQQFCNPNSPVQKSWPGWWAFWLSLVILKLRDRVKMRGLQSISLQTNPIRATRRASARHCSHISPCTYTGCRAHSGGVLVFRHHGSPVSS